MCIRFLNKKPELQEKSITITENGETIVSPDANKDGLSLVNITTNVSSSDIYEKDVNFYDYDGTLTNSYTKSEFLALSALPANPSHTGLTAQGWNWNLSDAKAFVTDYDKLDIGQTYTTTSGLSEFDIELTPTTGLEVTLNMNGTKNWGDGTTDTNTTHTYTNTGKYTITCSGDTITSLYGLFGQNSGSINYYVKNIRWANANNIINSTFQYCYSLINITIPEAITNIFGSAFSNCYSLTNIIIPKNINAIDTATFSNCYSLTKIIIPKTVTNIFGSAFSNCYSLTNIIIPGNVTNSDGMIFSGCYSLAEIIMTNSIKTIGSYAMRYCYPLKRIIMPSSITQIGGGAFTSCFSLIACDFTKANAVPTLSNANAFYPRNETLKIIVPDSLYSNWIVETNWSTLADYIVKESDYNA